MSPKFTISMQFHMTTEEARRFVFAAVKLHQIRVSIIRFGPPKQVVRDVGLNEFEREWLVDSQINVVEIHYASSSGHSKTTDALVWNQGEQTDEQLLESQVTGGTNDSALFAKWKDLLRLLKAELPVRGRVASHTGGGRASPPKRMISTGAARRAVEDKLRLALFGRNEVVVDAST
jgi:hypothetical protein